MTGQRVRGATKVAELRLGLLIGRQLFPLGLVGMVLFLTRDHFPVLNLTDIWATFQQVRPDQWAFAALATGASFWAVGRYDSVLHRLTGTGISTRQARQSGVAAIAIAQFAGFGVITGALVRWHLLPGLSLGRAFRVSLTVSMSFLAGWAVVTALAVLLSGLDAPRLDNIAGVVLAVAGVAGIALVLAPPRHANLPTFRCIGNILFLVLVDTAFAALALYALLPVGIDIAPITLLAVFLVALGAGLLGSTPGGVGPFELCLLTLLPAIPDASILASALAFRVVYYALPAAIGLVVLGVGLRRTTNMPAPQLRVLANSPYMPADLERSLWTAPRAEANLIRQGDFRPLMDGQDPLAIAAPVGQSMVMLGDPISTFNSTATVLGLLHNLSTDRQRSPLVYKCSAKTALAARQHGWQVLPVAREAWINPSSFTPIGARFRQLRRSLRKAENLGVSITEAGRELPLSDMQALAERWSKAHGGENGFSMGMFNPGYVSCQRVFLAHHQGRLVGFTTFHEVRAEWCLDLMRLEQDAPAGTMHLLINHAIASAGSVQCQRMSLAAVPHDGTGDGPWLATVRRALLNRQNHAGLLRFKSSFNPHWETRYALARNRFSMLHGLWALYRRINKA